MSNGIGNIAQRFPTDVIDIILCCKVKSQQPYFGMYQIAIFIMYPICFGIWLSSSSEHIVHTGISERLLKLCGVSI